ncbi:MAG: hypothetical protein IIZ40_02510 [Bacilli bacterium]|nr:hypothetical protein [Bacilli bacterium]
MDGIFFLVLSFLVMFSSIKLSYYGDALSNETKLGKEFVGGLLIASITSLPELVTSISAVLLNNPRLSFGDILGSNMFNIFVLSVFNIFFFKKMMFKNIDIRYKIESLILILEYLCIYISSKIKSFDLTTFLMIILYLVYIFRVIKIGKEEESSNSKRINNPGLKFFLTAIILIILSILLTGEADKISHIYPNISSSTIGAILLGITTSLPEVVSTYTLIKIDNIDMAISNMLGSNIFNFFILSISDFFVKNDHIYNYNDIYSYLYLVGGFIITNLLLISITKKNKNNRFYVLISLLMSFIYLIVWYFQFK